MSETGFASAWNDDERRIRIARTAPTEKANGHMLRGEVHDPRSRALGGVAGHAGLFKHRR